MNRYLLVLIILLLAFGLRVYELAEHNIWWDEGLTIWAARASLREIVHWTAHDVHPPLYFLLMRGWRALVGEGEVVLRFPSALAGTLGVAAIYGLGSTLGGKRAGLLSALLLTCSRFAISWSQEMRMYVFAATLSTGALWAAVQMWKRPAARGPWLAYVLTVAAGLWSLYLTVSLPLIVNLAFPLVWARRGRPGHLLTNWITAQVAVAVLYIPWLVYALPRMPTWSTAEPFSPEFFIRLYATMLAIGVPVNLEAYAPLTVAVWGMLALGLYCLRRSLSSPVQRGGLALLVWGLILPALVVYVVSLPIHLYYAPRLAPRYLLPLSVCFYTLLGWALAGLSSGQPRLAMAGSSLVLVAALSGLADYYFPARARRDDYVSVALTLLAHRHPGDSVLLHTDKDWPVFTAHYAASWDKIPYGAMVDEALIAQYVAPVWERSQAVWVVATPDAQRTDPYGRVLHWLRERASAAQEWRFGENALYLYARTPARAVTIRDLAPGAASLHTRPLEAEFPLTRYQSGSTLHLFLYWYTPPTSAVTVRLRKADGTIAKEVVAPAPVAASQGPTRQQIDLPLTPELGCGEYRVVVVAGDREEDVGRFTIVPRRFTVAVQPVDAASISHPLDVRLGEHIRLVGYDLQQTVVAPGGRVELTLYWQADAPVPLRYKVFTHLLGEQYNATLGNFLWGQQDNEPVNGQMPTTIWLPGTVIADPYTIPVAPDAPPGHYQIEVGLYGLVDGERLPVIRDGVAIDNRIILASIEVISK
ncbi:MAG: glycosyltransferase family 39 protein [Anaerolineae bacterium]|nr:glycosyltransferase family 39 protein [Anaerolineae bacterium]